MLAAAAVGVCERKNLLPDLRAERGCTSTHPQFTRRIIRHIIYNLTDMILRAFFCKDICGRFPSLALLFGMLYLITLEIPPFPLMSSNVT